MFAQSSNAHGNPTKPAGTPSEREPFDLFLDENPIIDGPPEEDAAEEDYDPTKNAPPSKPREPPILPKSPGNPTN